MGGGRGGVESFGKYAYPRSNAAGYIYILDDGVGESEKDMRFRAETNLRQAHGDYLRVTNLIYSLVFLIIKQ